MLCDAAENLPRPSFSDDCSDNGPLVLKHAVTTRPLQIKNPLELPALYKSLTPTEMVFHPRIARLNKEISIYVRAKFIHFSAYLPM
jgi:hypothetical protein